jgi:V/A-type H+-transporting ATPase subunit C
LIARVLKYSFAQAKTRALKGRLFSADDWHFLLRCKNLEDILKYLSGTDYATALSHLPQGKPEAKAISLALYDELFRDYAKLSEATPRKGSSLLIALLSRYEAENLKTILRGIWAERSASGTRFFLYQLGTLSRLPVGGLLQVQKIPNAIELLKSTIFYSPLIHALPQFKAQGKLFPLEVAIDITVFEHIVEILNFLGGHDRRGSQVLIGELIDFENVSWLARFRHFYGLLPEETINYIVRGGKRLGIRDLGILARSHDLPSFLKALPQPYAEALNQAKDWPDIESLFERWLLVQLYKAFRKDPFEIRLQFSYLLLKEMEVKALDGLVSALDFGWPIEKSLEILGVLPQLEYWIRSEAPRP